MNLQEALERAKAQKKAAAGGEEAIEAPRQTEKAPEIILVETYGDVRIYKEPYEPLYVYEVPSPHLKGEERGLINTLLEIATGVISESDTIKLAKEEKRAKYLQKVLEIISNTPELKIPIHAKQFYAEAVVKEMTGYGILDPLVDDDLLEEIMIIGPGKPVYVFHRKYEMMKTNVIYYEDRDIVNLIDKMARTVGRRIDIQSPLLDARLPDGSRVNATIPPASINGSTLTLRKFRKDPFTVIDLIKYGTMDFDVAAFLWVVSDGFGALPANILVSGGTASGKTSTLNVLSSFIPKDERIVSIEDTAELALPLDHWIRMEVRPASAEGSGEINMDTLVKNSLRMRPDRIIVGEIRGEEGFTLFTAMNTGHRGCLGTVHANSAHETLVRLQSPPISVPPIMIGALNFVIMQHRLHDRRKGVIRRITEIAEINQDGGTTPSLQVLYQWDSNKDKLLPTGMASNFIQMLANFTGLQKSDVYEEMETRKKILMDLSAKGVRGIEEVCAVTQNYVLQKRGKI
ncbi:MAG TPA: CpaF family protein [Candidatus Norongarragalinales archaeon]|nr:CpaF family protein [Candidatus Norongarragalinales archaeon]